MRNLHYLMETKSSCLLGADWSILLQPKDTHLKSWTCPLQINSYHFAALQRNLNLWTTSCMTSLLNKIKDWQQPNLKRLELQSMNLHKNKSITKTIILQEHEQELLFLKRSQLFLTLIPEWFITLCDVRIKVW